MKNLSEKPLISDSPLIYSAIQNDDYEEWARGRYGKEFMNWVKKNWITATEREILCMSRAWHAAKKKFKK